MECSKALLLGDFIAHGTSLLIQPLPMGSDEFPSHLRLAQSKEIDTPQEKTELTRPTVDACQQTTIKRFF